MASTISAAPSATPLDSKVTTVTMSVELSPPATPENELDEDIEARIPRTVDELIRLRARQEGCNMPIVAYPNGNSADYKDYTPKDIDDLVERAAAHYTSVIPQRIRSDDPVEVVGFLGNSDLSYFISFLAISRLGHAALLLSTRITNEAIESLLLSTDATTLLHHSGFADAAAMAKTKDLRSQVICDPSTLPDSRLPRTANLDYARETNNRSFIIHSSGSTGLPKPIFQTHSASLYAYSQHFNMVGHITLPLYHNHGICCFFRAIYSRKKIYIYNAGLPLTSKNLLCTLEQHPDIRILYGVPYALKLLSESEAGLRLLARLDIVMFGGSACPKPLGDLLVNNGVNLVGHYGATEVGQLMTSFRDHRSDRGWDWLRVPTHLKPFLSMEARGPNIFELCVLSGWPSKVATNREDGSYATKDLFEPHPSIPDAWKYYARLDDTITLENGEKANPLLTEGVLRQNIDVMEVVVFGIGKPRLGAFLIPAAGSKLSKEELLDAVMPAILDMNAQVPAYAHLSRDMIFVLPHEVTYRRTDKGTVIRAAFYKEFSDRIEAAYLDRSTGSLVLGKEQLIASLRKEILSRSKLDDADMLDNNTTDLFALGFDSLHAIQIRSFILKNLKLKATDIGRNFLFDFPTIEAMAEEIFRIQSGGDEKCKATTEEKMAAMIEKYAVFRNHEPRESANKAKQVVLTGATGSLGAHVVANLAKQESVRKIYCLVRATNAKQAHSRIRQSLRSRCVYHTLSLCDRSKIVALPSDFSDEYIGLDRSQYEEIAKDITDLYHFAWSVNFNKNIGSFERDCIAGVRNLINLCLRSERPEPASFNFCSSVSAAVQTPGGLVPESLPASLLYAQNMGYAQSKLVAEHLCDRAAAQTGIQARVLRVGQIIGDTQFGIWNDTEAIPMIFQTAKTIGALPELNETPAWLPVDVVANVCIDVASSSAPSGVFNIVNHNTFHWTRDLLPQIKSSGLEFDTVPQREWIRRLRESYQDPVENPPIKLLDFFASKYDNDEPRKQLVYANDKSQGYSLSLQNAGTIDQALSRKIISNLQRTWSKTQQIEKPPIAFIIGGPCGSGKTTLASSLSKAFSTSCIEGDDLHSLACRRQMANLIPLNDADRMSWLAHIRGAIIDRLRLSGDEVGQRAVFVTCSALKRSYRDQLRQLEELANIRTLFVMLSTDRRDELKARLSRRLGHYMTSSMVDDQVNIFQAAERDEVDIVEIDASGSAEEVLREVQEIVGDEI